MQKEIQEKLRAVTVCKDIKVLIGILRPLIFLIFKGK